MSETIPFTDLDLARQRAIKSGLYEFTFGGGFTAGWDAAFAAAMELVADEQLRGDIETLEDAVYNDALQDAIQALRNYRAEN